MAVYTKINKLKIKNILKKKYSINNIKIKNIKNGSENSNFFLKFDKKYYVMTILESNNKLKYIMRNIELFEILYYNNFCSPKIIIDKNKKYYFFYKKKYTLIISKLKGKSLYEPKKRECFYLGLLISKFHNLKKFNFLFKKNKINIIELIKTYRKVKSKISKKNREFIKNEFRYQIKNLNKYIFLPVGINHCDIFKDNILFNDKKISGFFDFYFFGIDFFLFDLSIVIFEWCFKKKLIYENLSYFILAYNSLRKINFNELKCFNQFIRFVALRFLLSRIYNNKKYKNKDPYIYKNVIKYFKTKNIFKIIKKILNDKKLYNK
ncbi:phosphotransferase [Candidatus Vidania fulgoroideorum]